MKINSIKDLTNTWAKTLSNFRDKAPARQEKIVCDVNTDLDTINAFIDDIIEVYNKHGLCIGDWYDTRTLTIDPYSETNVDALRNAIVTSNDD